MTSQDKPKNWLHIGYDVGLGKIKRPLGFPDSLNKPSRTIITGEGGRSPSRFKHVVETKSGRLRRLNPIELERLNMFPDRHTEGAGDTKRAFFMGNALVVGVVKGLSMALTQNLS